MTTDAREPIRRLARRPVARMVPTPIASEAGLFLVDATWGTISPIEILAGVRTVGELEVIDHVERRLPLIDTRLESF